MAAGQQTLGLEGIVTSWAGTANTVLIGAIGEHTCNISVDGGTADRTQYVASLSSMAYGPGLRSWNGSIKGRYIGAGTAQVGYLGAVTYASGYTYHVQDWSAGIKAKSLDITAYDASATAAGWRQFRPGLLSIDGRYNALVDSANAIVMPTAPGTASAAATFTLTTGVTLAGNILPSQIGVVIPVGDLNKVAYSWVMDGALTAAGSNNIFAAGAVGLPDWDASGTDGVPDTTLVVQAASGRTYTGAAFWTSINIDHKPGSYIDVTVNFQGSGALTPA